MAKRSRRWSKRTAPPPPTASARTYVRLAARDMALFKFLLEGHDHLGYATLMNRLGPRRDQGVLCVTCSPSQTRELRAFLESLKGEMAVQVVLDRTGGREAQ